jgi:cellulose biosynthesis protein BcsQ
MLLALDRIRTLESKLNSYKKKGAIIDFRIILKLNMSINLYVVSDKLSEAELEPDINSSQLEVDLSIISKQDYESDEYYISLFKNTKHVDMGLRRSLTNVIDVSVPSNISTAPIISFYSYKGGVGRSTALALFASYYSMHYGKKVFIIDCDFEAPGLTNFFGLEPVVRPRNGLVEYIKDKEAIKSITLNEDYVYTIARNFTGEGEIYLLSSGNISSDKDRSDYLEALSRLDIHSSTTIMNQFASVLIEINDGYTPDLILLDSRTGFTDIFALTALKFSKAAIGFFGNAAQNMPGLQFFLSTLLKHFSMIKPILVLSIISSSFTKQMQMFHSSVEQYIVTLLGDKLDSIPAIPEYYLSRYPSLEKIGTQDEDIEDFVTIVRTKAFNDYINLFDEIINTIEEIKGAKVTAEKACELQPSKAAKTSKSIPGKLLELKTKILSSLDSNFPEPYGDYLPRNDPRFWNSKFYFRACMEEVFNPDKFLLLGSKGTGKTAFYLALKQDEFFSKLLTKTKKLKSGYECISVVSMRDDAQSSLRFIDASTLFPLSGISSPEYFFRRFWTVFIWNAIRLDSAKIGYESSLHLSPKPISDDTESANFLKKYISDKDTYPKIEKDLQLLDLWAVQQNKHLLLTFDRLDEIIRPIQWPDGIAPLITYCQSQRFKRLHPKLFMRRDLYDKLTNLTNKEALSRLSVNLEWSREELYAFFFKIVFSSSADDFLDYAESIKNGEGAALEAARKIIREAISYNQLPPDEHLLKPLVGIFFGKQAQSGSVVHYGSMYDWIYINLTNADRTISLRPFLDLIKYAIQKQNSTSWLRDCEYPIIDPRSFSGDVRGRAVEGHFKDLSQEKGNEALSIIIDDIRSDRVPKSLKYSSLSQADFEQLMKKIVENNPGNDEIKSMTFLDFENILKLNGIIFTKYEHGGTKKYSFAYLYKYFLGLRSPMRFYQ